MKRAVVRPSISLDGKEDAMKLSICSPIVVVIGPFPVARPAVSVVADVDPKPGAKIVLALGGKRAHRVRLSRARRCGSATPDWA
jgi:hypothetical protein